VEVFRRENVTRKQREKRTKGNKRKEGLLSYLIELSIQYMKKEKREEKKSFWKAVVASTNGY